MVAGGSDFERTLRRGLSFYLGKIRICGGFSARYLTFFYRVQPLFAAQMEDEALEVRYAPRPHASDDRHLVGVLGRDEQFHVVRAREESRRHRAANSAEPSVERELAYIKRRPLGAYASGFLCKSHGYRQVEQGTLFGQVGGRQVDRHAPFERDSC